MNSPEALLFDYGGTLDLPGRHWYWVFEEAYRNLQIPFCRQKLREAYVQAERVLERHPLILPQDDFIQLLCKKIRLQAQSYPLALSDEQVFKLARWCDDKVRSHLSSTQSVLNSLKLKYLMGIVSNFYGNLSTVLQGYGLSPYFQSVTESYYAGIRKPDAVIFRLACQQLGFEPGKVCVIGDSLKNDIYPASSIGCSVIWIKGEQWAPSILQSPSDITSIMALEELKNLL